MKNWTASNIPQRNEGLAVITGSTEGIGYEDALALSSAGWNVIMMGRKAQKGDESIVKIHQINPKAKVCFPGLDVPEQHHLGIIQSDLIMAVRRLVLSNFLHNIFCLIKIYA